MSELARTHWHGVVSLPMSVSVPLFGSGGYKKAIDAKKKLLAIIMERLENNDSDFFNELKASNDSVMTKDLLYNHNAEAITLSDLSLNDTGDYW